MMVFPAALIWVVPAGTVTEAEGPTAVMRPLVTTIVPCSMGALPVPWIIRAPVNATLPLPGVCASEG